MARPQLKHTATMCTLIQAAKLLNINSPQLRRRLESGAFLPPSLVDENGTRYFDRLWILDARHALQEETDPKTRMRIVPSPRTQLIELEPEPRQEEANLGCSEPSQ